MFTLKKMLWFLALAMSSVSSYSPLNTDDTYFQDLIQKQPIDTTVLKQLDTQNTITQTKINQGMKVCNVLEMSGIGAFGAISAGLGSKLYEQGMLNKSYDVIVGSSGTAINALLLGKSQDIGKSFSVMRGFWSSLQNKYVYVENSSVIEENWGFLSNKPLQQTISNLAKVTGNTYYRNTLVNVGNLNYQKIDTYDLSDPINNGMENQIIPASMNLPFYFEKMMLNGNYSIDGAIGGMTSFNSIRSIKECDYYNFDIITVYDNIHKQSIHDFKSYYISLGNFAGIFFLKEKIKFYSSCKNPMGTINIYNSQGNNMMYHHDKLHKIIDYSNGTKWISVGIANDYDFYSIPFC